MPLYRLLRFQRRALGLTMTSACSDGDPLQCWICFWGTKLKCFSAIDYGHYQINCRLSHQLFARPRDHTSGGLGNPCSRNAGIINPIAVADIEAVLGAVPPDRVLDEPGKSLRKRWIELPGIDPLGDGLQ